MPSLPGSLRRNRKRRLSNHWLSRVGCVRLAEPSGTEAEGVCHQSWEGLAKGTGSGSPSPPALYIRHLPRWSCDIPSARIQEHTGKSWTEQFSGRHQQHHSCSHNTLALRFDFLQNVNYSCKGNPWGLGPGVAPGQGGFILLEHIALCLTTLPICDMAASVTTGINLQHRLAEAATASRSL